MHEDIVLTPMMKQFLDLKAKHPDAVMLFVVVTSNENLFHRCRRRVRNPRIP